LLFIWRSFLSGGGYLLTREEGVVIQGKVSSGTERKDSPIKKKRYHNRLVSKTRGV